MVDIGLVLLFVFVSSVLGMVGGLLLLVNKKIAYRLTFYFVGFAAGALLATSFLDLLPGAFEISKDSFVLAYTLAGILVFFFIEEFLIWHHHHAYGKKEFHSYNYLIIIGDTVHNFIDGIIIASSFMFSPALGIPAFLAVIFHEIPQEVGDFGILLHGKMRRSRIILYNALSAMASLFGAVFAFKLISIAGGFLPAFIAFAAGSFIYIAVADLMPESRKEKNVRRSILQILLLVAGIAVIWLAGQTLG